MNKNIIIKITCVCLPHFPLTTLVVFVIKQGKPGASEDERGSTSVALDREGYLYVGCENGQIHVMNYQYLMNTNRQTRVRIEKK